MRILHFAVAEKFIPLTQELYEAAFPGQNTFRILDSKHHPCKKIKVSAQVRKVPESYFYSEELARESRNFDLLIVHSMLQAFAAGVKTVSPEIFVVWCGWGYDYYPVMTPEFGNLFLPETLRLNQEIQALFAKEPLTPARFLKKLARRLGVRPQPSPLPEKKETLKSVAGRINLFSVLPTEVAMLKRALPGLGASNHPLRYYTTEDILSKGPERMSGSGILLGNSPTPANNHVEALKMLQPILPEDASLVVPLNYGDPEKFKFYGDSISKLGSELFGKRFKPLRAWLPLEAYHRMISRCGTVIMNHRRQQGLGTISAALYKGAKVFLRPENPVYSWYREMGVVLFSTEELAASGAAALGPLSEKDWENNRGIVGNFWSRKSALQAIREIESFMRR